jgi:DNA-binding NarL/FixJ family response regulator
LTEHTDIFLADDHELVSQGIAAIISNSFRNCRVSAFKNGKLLFEAVEKNPPHIIFLDYEMPVWDGKTTLVALRRSYPKIPVMMLSMINEKSLIEDCMKHGALGFINKDCSIEDFKLAIKSARSGSIFYSHEVLKVMQGLKPVAAAHDVPVYYLTQRELEVLKLLCDGLSPREIGNQIFLSPRTIEKHKDNIMQKLDVNSVSRLISFAIKNKIV